MLVGELYGKVGVAPGTTVIQLGDGTVPALTEDEYRAADIEVRQKEVEVRRKEAFWAGFAAFGTSTISILALVGVATAFLRTGKLKTPATR
jgi:hypothetical protein